LPILALFSLGDKKATETIIFVVTSSKEAKASIANVAVVGVFAQDTSSTSIQLKRLVWKIRKGLFVLINQ
jgi:hypothetical protein